MIKRGTIQDYREVTSGSAMVSRAEVEAARAGGRKAKQARRAAGEDVEVKRSPVKRGDLVSSASTVYVKDQLQNRRKVMRVKEVLKDSETGLAIVIDSNGREYYWDADDFGDMLRDGRARLESPTWLLDAIGAQMVRDGHDAQAATLASFASDYQEFLESQKPKCAWCGDGSNQELGKLRRKKGAEDWYHAECQTASVEGALARGSKIRVRKVSADVEERPSVRRPAFKVSKAAAEADDVPGLRKKMTGTELKRRKELAKREEHTTWQKPQQVRRAGLMSRRRRSQ